jgi:hypothetical protein
MNINKHFRQYKTLSSFTNASGSFIEAKNHVPVKRLIPLPSTHEKKNNGRGANRLRPSHSKVA